MKTETKRERQKVGEGGREGGRKTDGQRDTEERERVSSQLIYRLN